VNLVTDGDMYKCKHCEKEAALCPSLRRVRRNSLGFVFPTLCGTCYEHSKAKPRWERLDWLKANHVRELNPNSSSSSIAPTVSPSPQVSISAQAEATSIASPLASTSASTAAAVSQSLRASSALPEPKVSAKGEVKGTPGCASKSQSESKSESALCARKKPVRAPPTLEGKSANTPSISKGNGLGKSTVAPCLPASVPMSAVETVVISGAKGGAAFTNGSYLFGGERNGRPFFTKSNLYIYYASAGWWVVSDIDNFKDTTSSGWCSSGIGEYGHPADAKPWVCHSGEPPIQLPIKVRRKK
jgi:hypothetical protein